MASGMAKNLSLAGTGWFYHPDHSDANDYLYVSAGSKSNRQIVLDSHTAYVNLWVSWFLMQGNDRTDWPVPTTWQSSWAQLQIANPWWAILDQQIAAANIDGRGVILRCLHSYPKWARVQGTPPGNLSADAALPVNTTTQGPWAWWISYLCSRYKPGAAVNPTGPRAPGPGEGVNVMFGNPLGAGILTLCPMNEINLKSWGRNRVDATVEMIRTAAAYRDLLGSPPTLLVPDQDDTARLDSNGNIYPPDTYPYDTYCAGILAQLQGNFAPGGYVGWSAHNYFDVKYRASNPVTDTHSYYIRSQLYAKAWKGATADRQLFLTEGGLDIHGGETEGDQNTKCNASFNQMKAFADVVMWTNHMIRVVDPSTAPFDSALWAGDRERPWGTTYDSLS